MTSPSGLWTEGDTLSPTNLNRRNPVGTFPAKTYHVAWATGTGTTQINNAIVNAKAGGYTAVFIDASRLPFDANAVAFDNAIHMLCEGGSLSLSSHDPRAYGAAGDGVQDDYFALQAALDAIAASTRSRTLDCGPYIFKHSKPLWAKKDNIRVLGANQGQVNSNLPETRFVPSTLYGPAWLFQDSAASVPGLTTSLVSGAGQAWTNADTNHWFNLRDAKTCDLNGLSAFTFACYYKPSSVTGNANLIASSGRLFLGETTHQAFWLNVQNSGLARIDVTFTSAGAKAIQDSTPLVVGTTYLIAATYDGANLRLFRGPAGGTISLIGTVAVAGDTLKQDVSEEVTLGVYFDLQPEATKQNCQLGTIDGVLIDGTARWTAQFTDTATKPAVTATTRMIVNFEDAFGPFVRGRTKDGDAWLWHRQDNPEVNGLTFEVSGITIAGSGDGPIGIIVPRNCLNWKVSRYFAITCRRGIYSPSANASFFYTVRDGYMVATTGRSAIAVTSGIGEITNVNTLGYQVPFLIASNTVKLDTVFVESQNSTIYGMALNSFSGNVPPNGRVMTAINCGISTEAGSSTLSYALAVCGGLQWIGGGIESGTGNRPFVFADTIGITKFSNVVFSFISTPTEIITANGTFQQPVKIDNCAQISGTWKPWSLTTGAVAIARIGPNFSASTGGTLRFDASLADEWDLTLTSDVTQSSWQSISYGQPVSGAIKMDSTGSRLFTWPTNSKGTVTLSYGSAAINTFTGFYDGVNVILTSVRTGL